MKIGALSWSGNNIGDDIQTVAVMQHLPPVDIFLNRDELHAYQGPEVLLVMNGWFLGQTDNWPPSKDIRPIFFGFHVQDKARAAVARHADYLRGFAPIGCRDTTTVNFIRSLGVDAYLSLCATLTFQAPKNRNPDSLYLVEADIGIFDRSLQIGKGLIIRQASHRFIDVPTETRLRYARELVTTYGQKAAMVVTSRIHCAMPCVAMGIPTLFCGPVTFRTEIIEEIGLKRHDDDLSPLPRLLRGKIKALPERIDISDLQARVKADLQSKIAQALA